MQHSEPASVEEILESIKKVIARDNRAGAIEERRRRESAGVSALPTPDLPPEPAGIEEAEEVLELGEADFLDQNGADGEADPGDDAAPADAEEVDDIDVPLIRAAVRGSMRDNFAALAMLAEPGAQPQIVRSGETSLEGLTRELLRPMLSEWLDRNLPPMVEKLVKAEIARIAGKRG